MSYVVKAPPIPTVPVVGGGEYPVRRIYCVGRNYAEHAREMGHDPDREDPFFFMKPADAVLLDGATMPYPTMSKSVHHEIEMVVALGRGGRDVSVTDAPSLIFGYAVGIDLTRRDLQTEAKKMGRPWDMGKGFDQSAPIAAIQPAAGFKLADKAAIWIKINGETKQNSDLSKLIWSVPEVISYLSRYVELFPGDLIYSGTPEGVNKVEPGDDIVGHVDGLPDLHIRIAK